MDGNWVLALIFVGGMACSDARAEAPTGRTQELAISANPAAALQALERERAQAIATFDWGKRADFGARLLEYDRLVKSFDRRDLALRADWLVAEGQPEKAARLRAESKAQLDAAEAQLQSAPLPAPAATEPAAVADAISQPRAGEVQR